MAALEKQSATVVWRRSISKARSSLYFRVTAGVDDACYRGGMKIFICL